MDNIILTRTYSESLSTLNIVKISGNNCNNFVKPLIKINLKPQKIIYTKLYKYEKKKKKKKICYDYILVVYFKAPKSLTGEDIVEFHLHGNEFLTDLLVKDLIKLGAKIAKPGEFLERRYLNGKISLIECEMINNKIVYNNENMFKLTIEEQKNFFLCIIKNSKFRINMMIICLEIISRNEKESFFDDFKFIKNFLKKFKNLLNIIHLKIKKIDYFKKNFEIMIIGRRNVGKSTLFNKLCLQYDSIVTNIPGTTTNNITKQIYFSSKKVNLNDTAGLKIKSKNLIEKIGILKNINKIYKSNLILYIVNQFSLKNIFYNTPINFFEKIKNNELLLLINKCDIFGIREGIYKINNMLVIFLSAKHSVLIYRIKCFLSKIIDNEKLLLNNKLCYSNVNLLFNNCKIFYKEFCCSYDIILEKIINFQKDIYKMTGEYTNFFIINSLFRNFCMGK